MLPSVVAHRRALHRIPELSDQLPETAAYVRSVLAPLSCTVTTPIPSAICAFFRCRKAGNRGLPCGHGCPAVTERTGLPYASIHPGRMHACGHDGHMSMALALAELCVRAFIRAAAQCALPLPACRRDRLAVPVPHCAPPEFWSNTMSSV